MNRSHINLLYKWHEICLPRSRAFLSTSAMLSVETLGRSTMTVIGTLIILCCFMAASGSASGEEVRAGEGDHMLDSSSQSVVIGEVISQRVLSDDRGYDLRAALVGGDDGQMIFFEVCESDPLRASGSVIVTPREKCVPAFLNNRGEPVVISEQEWLSSMSFEEVQMVDELRNLRTYTRNAQDDRRFSSTGAGLMTVVGGTILLDRSAPMMIRQITVLFHRSIQPMVRSVAQAGVYILGVVGIALSSITVARGVSDLWDRTEINSALRELEELEKTAEARDEAGDKITELSEEFYFDFEVLKDYLGPWDDAEEEVILRGREGPDDQNIKTTASVKNLIHDLGVYLSIRLASASSISQTCLPGDTSQQPSCSRL